MLIGELARRTGVGERLLRHYERAGLIRSERRANGYRDYEEHTVETVRRIRALLAAGLPTRTIRLLLPCTDGAAALRPCPGVLAGLRDRLAVLDRRADELEAARHLLRQSIAATARRQDDP
ncbi:MerR family transcriptional regulator [Kitasatospora sp. NA04385]|uniref:MerR family transcriptional regulator n=1 Tax=Kitasatospora sp. NA04385 TaxID=2742135 RepID=UPI00159189CC|nr:MerR family transcriptional regulator [Kitasatospora sp. NA04385]QKW17851.1 MerR family transcriptional regulator [Kitasatospora sp. NA04385]